MVTMTGELTYRLFFPALLLLAAAAAAAAGAAESRSVKDFQHIRFAVPGQLTVLQGEQTTLELDASQEDLARVETTVQDDVLIIGWSGGWFATDPQGDVHVRVTVPKLRSIDLVGSGEVLAGSWSAEAFALSISGSGSVHMVELQADELKARISGSGDVVIDNADLSVLDLQITGSGGATLAGRATAQDIRVQGSGVVDAGALQGATAAVSVTGSGGAEVWAQRRLSVELQGSGKVRYRDEPELVQNVSGSGSISALNSPR
jgi:hypothetical protein